MITIRLPDNFAPERKYIVDMLFREFLGLQYKLEPNNATKCYEITLENNKVIVVKDHFFLKFEDGLDYLNESEIPGRIEFSKNRFYPEATVPIIYGDDEMTVKENMIICGIDIFASSFFMLSRWEEYANTRRDSHNRFPALASLAFRNGLLDSAVVNEYVEMLWNMLSYLKCAQKRGDRHFKTFVTHDVDEPYCYALKDSMTALKQLGNDLFKSKKPSDAFNNMYSWLRVKSGHKAVDPYNTFDYIMTVSEKFNLKSQFNFIAECSTSFDGNYDLHHQLLRKLMVNIHKRGHEIGLHSSYKSFDNPLQTKKEMEMLKLVCEEEGIDQPSWGSRQHFLRWETPTTPNNLELANLDYDSTLSYADAAGFRCGVCYEFPIFNILTRRCMKLREKSLLVMECSVIDKQYMNLGTGGEAFAVIKSIKDTCKRFNGDFVILWHNTRFIKQEERELYSQTLLA